MKGRNHIATGAALGVSAVLAAGYLPEQALGQLSPFSRYGPGAAGAVACAGCAALYVLGLVLPDVDNGGLASKWLHFSLPLRHRGWTHSLWAMAPFLAAAAMRPWAWPLRFIALGMLAHDLMDALSQAGWVPLYPMGRWRTYHNTVMARGWTPGLYSSASPGTEDVAACAVVAVNAAWWAFWAYVRFFS